MAMTFANEFRLKKNSCNNFPTYNRRDIGALVPYILKMNIKTSIPCILEYTVTRYACCVKE